MQTSWAGITGVLLSCLCLACVGEIGGRGPGPGAGPGQGSPPRGSDGAPAAPGALDPGRVTLRRLNRTEYNSTARDLLGTSLVPADAFQTDPTGFGFDNNGDVQTLTTLQIEQYQAAAEALVAEATAGGLDRVAAAACRPRPMSGVRPCACSPTRRARR